MSMMMMMMMMMMIMRLCYTVVATCGLSQFKFTSLSGPVTCGSQGHPHCITREPSSVYWLTRLCPLFPWMGGAKPSTLALLPCVAHWPCGPVPFAVTLQICHYITMLSSALIWLLLPTPVSSTLWSCSTSWCFQNLFSLLLKVLVVSDDNHDISISSKQDTCNFKGDILT